jgi:hypothetical protein
MKKLLASRTYLIVLHVFAVIGLFLTLGYVAILLGLTNQKGIIDLNRSLGGSSATSTQAQAVNWIDTEEYQSFRNAVPKDADKINAAAKAADINPRLIVAALLAEQIRLYTDASRESFKQFFQPLQILGIQSQYSWGVMGIKRDTAVQIEDNLKDATSTYYLGPQYEHLLDFGDATDTEQARFDRLTAKHDQYYSYLYAALYMKQIMKQWSDAGFPIDNKPAIVATLYNIGFAHSTPNANPQAGGAAITVGGKTYSFGDLAYEFYYSNELLQYFPVK